MRSTCLFIAVGLVVGVALLILLGVPTTAQDLAIPQGSGPQNGDVCFARGYEGGTNPGIVFSSADSQAVRDAIAGAGDGDLVAVAGYCAGVATVQTIATTVYISDDITLRGGYTTTGWTYDPDTYTTTLDAQRGGRVVYIAAGSTATLDSLYIISGTTPTSNDGAGIYVDSNSVATLTHSTVYSNTSGWGGGGIHASTESTVTVSHSALCNNRARWGGGINCGEGSTVHVDDSSISHNHAIELGGGTAQGRATLTIDHSAVSSNTATTEGGGLYNNYGDLRLINSTVSGNQANKGGGIFNKVLALHLANARTTAYQVLSGEGVILVRYPEPQTVTLINSTVSRNQAATGAGICNDSFGHLSALAILSNTIVADQTSGADCSGTITSQGHNLDSDDTCDLTGALSDIRAGNAALGPLQFDAPGKTKTHALDWVSDAVDAGDCAGDTVGDDQRGVSRPKGSACDMGAYEFEPLPSIVVSKTSDRSTAGLGSTVWYSYRVTNTGNVALSSVRAVDDPLGAVSLNKAVLEPDEVATGTRSHTVVAADLPGPLANTVVVSGTPPASAVVTATDDASIELIHDPAIVVVKSADVVTATVGDTIWYSYLVTNTGNTTLGDVRATDDKLGSIALAKTSLAPEEATIASISYVVIETDLPGPLTNTVTVSGTPLLGPDVTAEDEVQVTLYKSGPSTWQAYLPIITKNLEPK